MKIELIIFDCDGVLVDSERISNGVVAELLTEEGLSMDGSDATRLFAGTNVGYIQKYFEEQTGNTLRPDFEQLYRERTFETFQESLEAVEGVEEVLQNLKDQKKCVASNGPKNKIRLNLKLTGLDKYFGENLFSAYDIQRWKPAPDLYLHAANKMGTPPLHCVVIEDSEAGVKAAKKAGMKVLGYCRETPKEKLSNAGAITFDSMNDLKQILINL